MSILSIIDIENLILYYEIITIPTFYVKFCDKQHIESIIMFTILPPLHLYNR